jgi:carbamoyltransferase
VGAAYWAYNHLLKQPRVEALTNRPTSARSYSDAEVEAFLRKYDIPFEHIADDDKFYDFVAHQLVDGAVCGWFRGRFEWGPRALGARSIIADPRKPEMKDKLNATIKFREAFRPFAPSVTVEAASEFFDIPDAARHYPARFMLYVAPVRPEGSAAAPGHHARGRLGPPADRLQGRLAGLPPRSSSASAS